MDIRLRECLEGRQASKHILPFFWLHGETHAVLLDELEAIYACGLREFCLESRTHEGFGEETWWDDIGFLLREARKRGMRVWILDDKHYPTGYANNYIDSRRDLRRKLLRMSYFDFAGPRSQAALMAPALAQGESFMSVVAYKRFKRGRELSNECVDLLPLLEGGLIFWDIPKGFWRIYYIVSTVVSDADRNPNYIDMLSLESCRAMIEAVYEPHWDHFKDYFGNTLAGFFSDEPCFSNERGHYWSRLGKEDMLLSWSPELADKIALRLGTSRAEALLRLPALWHETEQGTQETRVAYMDAVTAAFRDNFSFLLGDWCRAHGVLYIGHIIEDMGAHQRLGYGPGHFFRGLAGQDMSGIDIVLNQYIPGFTQLEHRAQVGGGIADPYFFNYTLPKLGASLAHIEPRMKGRAMCELFGAFGWAQGLPMMLHMANYLLVNGINYFVPHAFTPKYPDPDCPPHFFARGMNPQYALFGKLMDYMARCAHLLADARHLPDVAVWYSAESDWSGSECTSLDEVCATLSKHQIDYDILPTDTLISAKVVERKLNVNGENFAVLVVPWSSWQPDNLKIAINRLIAAGLTIVECQDAAILPFELEKLGCGGLSLSHPEPSLMHYHANREGKDIRMFFNENPFEPIDVQVMLNKPYMLYDAWENRLYNAWQDGQGLRLTLPPAGALFLLEGDEGVELARDDASAPLAEIDLKWDISLRAAGTEGFILYRTAAPLSNLAKELPAFCGTIRYEALLAVEQKYHRIDLGLVGETAQLWLNEDYIGARISAPYAFNCEINTGMQRLAIEVITSPAYRERDRYSLHLPFPPSGMVGPLTLC